MSKHDLNRVSIMFRVFVRRALLTGLFGVAVHTPWNDNLLAAQTTDSSAAETRAQLTARAHRADSLHLRDQSFILRTRLQDGDFEVGDRIIITSSALMLKGSDTTVVVRNNKVISFGEP